MGSGAKNRRRPATGPTEQERAVDRVRLRDPACSAGTDMSTRLLDQVSALQIKVAAPLFVFIQDRYPFDENIPKMTQ